VYDTIQPLSRRPQRACSAVHGRVSGRPGRAAPAVLTLNDYGLRTVAVVLLSGAATGNFVPSVREGMAVIRGVGALEGMLLLPGPSRGGDGPAVVTGPMGEIAKLEEATRYGRLLRADGRASAGSRDVTAPFIRIRPEIPGRFSGRGPIR